MPFGWDIYLRFHQSGTHSILGACVLGGGVGLLLSPLLRRRAVSLGRDQSTTAASGLALAFAACLAALSHLLLDVLSGAPLALASPLSDTHVTLPLVAMADPWLVALFVVSAAGMWVARRQLSKAAVAVLLAVSVLRGVLRSYAWDGGGPGSVLDRCDQLVQGLEMAAMATAVYARIEPAAPDGSRRWNTAVSVAIGLGLVLTALLVYTIDPSLDRIVKFASERKLPAVYARRDYPDAGGLMSYGADSTPLYAKTADYVHRIATGTKPGDLPVERPMAVRMVVNRARPSCARTMYTRASSGSEVCFRLSSELRTTAIGVRSSCDSRPAIFSW